MDYFHLAHLPILGMFIGTMVDILCATVCASYFVVRYAKKLLQRDGFKTQGRLLLHVEINGIINTQIGILTAEEREGKSTYVWSMSQINRDDFPYFSMTDLPFTHVRVTQKRTGEDLVTISVVDRAYGFWNADFYWIKSATIGNRPGFPRKLSLPHNLVLEYFDESFQ